MGSHARPEASSMPGRIKAQISNHGYVGLCHQNYFSNISLICICTIKGIK